MGLNLSCQHKMSTPLYIHSAGTKGYSRVGKLEIAQQLSQASTRQFTGSRTHQLIVSSTCKLVNSITHHLKNARTHQRTNAQPPQKQNAQPPQKQTQKLINSSVHQRTNSPTPNKQNSKTHQLVCSSTQELTNPRINNIQKLINSSAPHLKISSSKNLKIIIFILQAPSNFHVVLA